VDPVKKPPPGVGVLPPLPLVDEAEPDDDTAHAQPIESGKGIRGTIGKPKTVKGKPASDEDVYSWIEGGTPVGDGGLAFDEARVEVTGIPGVDLQLEVLDGDGKRLALANDAPAGEGEVIPNLGVDPGHTYYVRVKAAVPIEGTKPYELTVRSGPAPTGDEREPNDDVMHATPLVAVSDASGFYGRRRDEDWLALPAHAAAGSTLKIELTPVDGVAPQLRLYGGAALAPQPKGLPALKSAAPEVLAEARAGKGDELRLRNVGVPTEGSAWLALKAVEGRNAEIRWALRMSVEPPLDGVEKEPNDTLERATALPFTGVAQVSGFLWPGDVDVYRIAGAAPDGLVTAELDGLERVDLKLERLGSDGKTVLVKADDGGPGKSELLPPWPGGDVILRVSARARETAFDAPYHLTVTAVPADKELEREPNNTSAFATPWGEGPQMRGYLAPRGDEDWYRVVAPAGKSRVSVEANPPAVVRLSDENKVPLGPAEAVGHASGPVVAGKPYFVTVKAANEKSSNPKDPYTLTLKFE
jgi:hypothetical protein